MDFISENTHGRRKIFSSVDNINKDNILSIVNTALADFSVNIAEEEMLYMYRRGLTPVMNRKKERNTFVCNKVNENHADEIVSFKNGFFLTQPAFYVSRNGRAQNKVNKLNEYLYRSGKHHADNKVVDWFHTVGVGVMYVQPNDDNEVPVKCYALNPMNAFVIYSMRPGNAPLIGINAVSANGKLYIDAFTRDYVYRLVGESTTPSVISDRDYYTANARQIVSIEQNVLGEIPIIEYYYNSMLMSSFEGVLSLLNAIEDVQSNRLDAVAQFVQSLLVIYGSDLPEGEDASSMRKKGIMVLPKNGDGTQCDVKILSEELNQSQTQTLVDYLYQQVLTICQMPSTTKGGTSTSDTGAAVELRDGWAQASTCARNTEDLFKESNAYFDRIFVKILEQKGLLKISLSDFELNFVRNDTNNVYNKSQALLNLLSAGLAPELAFAKSGISSDPVSDVKMSKEWLEKRWGEEKLTVKEQNGMDDDSKTEPLIQENVTENASSLG